MALFEVPGWTVPKDGPSIPKTNPKKRKRGSGGNNPDKIQTAEVNIEKLMRKLQHGAENPQTRKGKDRGKGKVVDMQRKANKNHNNTSRAAENDSMSGNIHNKRKKDKHPRSPMKPNDLAKGSQHSRADAESTHATSDVSRRETKPNRNGKQKSAESYADQPENNVESPSIHDDADLTPLQKSMKKSLDGARFRWINETLYKCNSKDALRMMHDDPKMYDEYHAGFRHQVTSWPKNPVSHFITILSSYPKRSVIVDLGCGDAALARELTPEGYTVLSYDLVSVNPYITAADICDKLPLPGGEGAETDGQVVDVVVCSLSLMSTNWLNCIREARRVLKSGGELKIAEVSSRFKDVKEFTSVVCSVGFRLVSKDESNTHFTLFDFAKSDGRSLDDSAWRRLLPRGVVLQPCEYKRR